MYKMVKKKKYRTHEHPEPRIENNRENIIVTYNNKNFHYSCMHLFRMYNDHPDTNPTFYM